MCARVSYRVFCWLVGWLVGLILWIFSFKNTMFRDCRNIHIKKWVGYQEMTRFVYCGWVLHDYLIVDGLILWIFSFKNTMFRDCTKYTMRITCMILGDGLIDVCDIVLSLILYMIWGVLLSYTKCSVVNQNHTKYRMLLTRRI